MALNLNDADSAEDFRANPRRCLRKNPLANKAERVIFPGCEKIDEGLFKFGTR